MQRENTQPTHTHTYTDAQLQKMHTTVFVSVDKTVLRDSERRSGGGVQRGRQ